MLLSRRELNIRVDFSKPHGLAFAGGNGQGGEASTYAQQAVASANITTPSNASAIAQIPESGHGKRPPRGDDPRPRSWGAPDDRGESKFDDRKSPRTVAFLGRSANVRIYPNYSEPDVYLQLRFGKIQELDRTGRPVPGHKVPSLAAATTATFTSGNTTINGVNMSYVNVSLNPLTCPGFTLACRALADGDEDSDGSGTGSSPLPSASLAPSRRRLLSRRSLLGSPALADMSGAAAPQVNVSLLFGLDGALTLPYGDVNITVPANGLKWTVLYANWPFCNTSNTLSVALNLLVANNGSAQVDSDAANTSTQVRKIVLGSAYNATLGFLNYSLDGAATAAAAGDGGGVAATRMPVNVSLGQDGGVTSVVMGLPNPAAYNVSSGSVWYDPTQITTSAYLSADDPGNVAIATVMATTESGDTGVRFIPARGRVAGRLRGVAERGDDGRGATPCAVKERKRIAPRPLDPRLAGGTDGLPCRSVGVSMDIGG